MVRTHGETLMIVTALRIYRKEFGAPPSGTPGKVMQALRGANPKKIELLVFDPSRFAPSGEFLDAWGAPYHLDLSDPEHPRIHSSGPNRIDEGGKPGSDDICNYP